MTNDNYFFGECGDVVFAGKSYCKSCSRKEMRCEFSKITYELDDWYYSDFDDVDASEFEYEVASSVGESVETVVLCGFQLKTPEQEFCQESGNELALFTQRIAAAVLSKRKATGIWKLSSPKVPTRF